MRKTAVANFTLLYLFFYAWWRLQKSLLASVSLQWIFILTISRASINLSRMSGGLTKDVLLAIVLAYYGYSMFKLFRLVARSFAFIVSLAAVFNMKNDPIISFGKRAIIHLLSTYILSGCNGKLQKSNLIL